MVDWKVEKTTLDWIKPCHCCEVLNFQILHLTHWMTQVEESRRVRPIEAETHWIKDGPFWEVQNQSLKDFLFLQKNPILNNFVIELKSGTVDDHQGHSLPF